MTQVRICIKKKKYWYKKHAKSGTYYDVTDLTLAVPPVPDCPHMHWGHFLLRYGVYSMEELNIKFVEDQLGQGIVDKIYMSTQYLKQKIYDYGATFAQWARRDGDEIERCRGGEQLRCLS